MLRRSELNVLHNTYVCTSRIIVTVNCAFILNKFWIDCIALLKGVISKMSMGCKISKHAHSRWYN